MYYNMKIYRCRRSPILLVYAVSINVAKLYTYVWIYFVTSCYLNMQHLLTIYRLIINQRVFKNWIIQLFSWKMCWYISLKRNTPTGEHLATSSRENKKKETRNMRKCSYGLVMSTLRRSTMIALSFIPIAESKAVWNESKLCEW